MADRTARRAAPPPLLALARRRGILTTYTDGLGAKREATTPALLATLRALGDDLDSPAEAPAILRDLVRAERARLAPPVAVHWLGGGRKVGRRSEPSPRNTPLPLPPLPRSTRVSLTLEDGSPLPLRLTARGLLPDRPLPPGVHTLDLRAGRRESRVTLLAAPTTCYTPPTPPGTSERETALFIPLYALRSASPSSAVGTLTDLRDLARFAGSLGVSLVGTLPILASFLDEPFEPSPYSPVSRLYWNPLFVDAAAAPEFPLCRPARALLDSPGARATLRSLGRASLVDYRRASALQQRLLAALAETAFATPASRERIDRAVRADPDLPTFARFTAVTSRRTLTWNHWPRRMRTAADLRLADSDRAAERTEIYAQLLVREQLAALRDAESAEGAAGLYLDLPIGVNGGGYDVWRYRDQFAAAASVGAPPDALNASGQNWGFPPLHPHRSSESGHRYFRRVLAHHLAHCRALRIDHILGFHRQFWIPRGIDGADGLYVQYPADELYATLSIESHRHEARVIGENLGTVPPEVNRALARRRVLGMRVGLFEMPRAATDPPPRGGPNSLACLNTHDTPTFAGYWHGDDIDLRARLGHITAADAVTQRRERAATNSRLVATLRRARLLPRAGRVTPRAVLEASLRALAAGPSEIVLISLEDLWLERGPQNVPGTTDEHPNWRRVAARAHPSVTTDRTIRRLLRAIVAARRGTKKPSRRSAAR